MPKGLGGYQPDTKSPSSRRADFDLQRRLRLIEDAGGVPGPEGPAGPPGPPGAAVNTYVHVQGTPAATWVMTHNLGYYPNVHVEDSAGNDVEGDVHHDSINQLTEIFSGAFSGKAYLS